MKSTDQNCSANETERTEMAGSNFLNLISLVGGRARIRLGGFVLLDTSYSIQGLPNDFVSAQLVECDMPNEAQSIADWTTGVKQSEPTYRDT